jgi:NADH:ubiquinone oxidoreductase subunit C
MTQKLDTLQARWNRCSARSHQGLVRDRGEITITVRPPTTCGGLAHAARRPALKFEQLIDLCGLDYSALQGPALGRPALLRRLAPAERQPQLAPASEGVCARRRPARGGLA